MKQIIKNKLLPFLNNFSKNKYLAAISTGFASLIPAMLAGSLFSLLANIGIESYSNFITSTGIRQLLLLPAVMSMEVISLLVVFFIAYRLGEQFGLKGTIPGLLGLVCFLLVTPIGEMVNETGIAFKALSFEWIGPKGLFVAIIISLVSTRLLVFFLDKGLVIRMPEGVPVTIKESFESLLPVILVISIFLGVGGYFNSQHQSIHHFVFNFIQVPLQVIGGSYWALLLAILAMAGSWLLGIHGTMLILSMMNPIWMSMDLQNLAAFTAGETIPNIIGTKFMWTYVLVGGAGTTMGLALLMAYKAKSKKLSQLGKVVLPASIVNINEPLLYGTPMVMNPTLAIPFILTPLISGTLAYFATAMGLVPRLIAIQIPPLIPTVVSGFIQGGWRVSVLQAIIVIVSLVIYYPFFLILDKKLLQEEKVSDERQITNEVEKKSA